MTLPHFLPCPHAGCSALLAVPTRTPEGERARCGLCRQPTVYARGVLVAPVGPLKGTT